MSRKIENGRDLEAVGNSQEGALVLFYASWCPFSMRFLPVFEKHAERREECIARIVVDGNEDLFDEHGIQVYPSVLFFQNGQVTRRLDGRHLVGLSEGELTDLIASCGIVGGADKTAKPGKKS